MMWVTMAILAVILGLIMYSNINQDEIPDELGFLKAKPTATQPTTVVETPVIEQLAGGWTLRSAGTALEATKYFKAGVKAGAYQYEAPVLGLMCDGERLHVRIDSQAFLTGRVVTPVTVNGVEGLWHKAQGTNILAPNPGEMAKALLRSKEPVRFDLSYVELGVARTAFDATGLKAILERFPVACRG